LNHSCCQEKAVVVYNPLEFNQRYCRKKASRSAETDDSSTLKGGIWASRHAGQDPLFRILISLVLTPLFTVEGHNFENRSCVLKGYLGIYLVSEASRHARQLPLFRIWIGRVLAPLFTENCSRSDDFDDRCSCDSLNSFICTYGFS
jgi:hypothetical protein